MARICMEKHVLSNRWKAERRRLFLPSDVCDPKDKSNGPIYSKLTICSPITKVRAKQKAPSASITSGLYMQVARISASE
jgi:hypothetical protein